MNAPTNINTIEELNEFLSQPFADRDYNIWTQIQKHCLNGIFRDSHDLAKQLHENHPNLVCSHNELVYLIRTKIGVNSFVNKS